MIHSNLVLDDYHFIHPNSQTLAGGVEIYVKNSISFHLIPNISIDFP